MEGRGRVSVLQNNVILSQQNEYYNVSGGQNYSEKHMVPTHRRSHFTVGDITTYFLNTTRVWYV